MKFYTYQYLLDNQTHFPYLRSIIIAILAIAFIILLIRYLSNKLEIKYKDLAIIVATAMILMLAIQFNDYTNFRTSSQKSSQEVSLVKDVAKKLKVKPQKLLVNNLQTGSGDILVRSPRGDYRVIFNNDSSEYVLEKINLRSNTVTVKED